MDIQTKEIRQYIQSNGKIPFNEWLESFKDWKTRTKIETRLKRLKLGNFGDCKSVGDGIYELSINYGAGYRIFLVGFSI